MPLTAKGKKIMRSMKEQYGSKKGKEVFYASQNKGTIKGTHKQAADEIQACYMQGYMDKLAQHLKNVQQLPSLNPREVTRAIRDAIIAEQDAVKQYEVVADSADNRRVSKVLQDIADEEKVHVGELQQLLDELSDNEEHLEEGENEVREMSE